MANLIRPRHSGLLVLVVLGLGFAAPVLAQRPHSTKLLPKNTVVYVSVADAAQLKERFGQTAFGQMRQDPQLKPVVDQLYGALTRSAAAIEGRMGVSISELLDLPQGEAVFAVIADDSAAPAFALLLDTGEQPAVQRLIDAGLTQVKEQGATVRDETIDDVKLTIIEANGPQATKTAYFQHEGTFALVTDLDQARTLLGRWQGAEGESLADNERFAAVRLRTDAEGDQAPQITWFVDPIPLAQSIGRGNAGAALGMAILPALGLDGVNCVGGCVRLATEQYDLTSEVHIMLDNPRSGVVEMIAFLPGDSTPEAWAPADVAQYATFHWDFPRTYGQLRKVVDSFQGVGGFDRLVDRTVNRRIGVNLEQDILPALDGRVTRISIVEQPITIGSQGNAVGLRLKDPIAFQATLDKLLNELASNHTQEQFGGTTYYKFSFPQGGEGQTPQPAQTPPGGAPTAAAPRPEPCLAILGNYLILADRPSVLQKCIVTSTEPSLGLAESLEYKLIASRIQRQSGEQQPALVRFDRPVEGMRLMYGLAANFATTERPDDQAQGGNQFLGNLNDALSAQPLPPFAVLEQYLAPGGAILVDDEVGLHYTSFILRRKKL